MGKENIYKYFWYKFWGILMWYNDYEISILATELQIKRENKTVYIYTIHDAN